MPDYRFRCLGPFFFSTWQSPRHRVNRYMLFDPDAARDEIFEQAQAHQHRLRTGDVKITSIEDAIGLYVIGLKSGRRLVPYYVGKAARQTIHTRLFQKQDKTAKVQAILNENPGAKPFVFLFPMVTATGQLARKPREGTSIGSTRVEKVIANAEHMMIGHAMHTNPWLHNISTVVARESFVIDGSPQAKGRETDFARAYRSMMGFTQPVPDARRIQAATERADEREAEIEAAVEDALKHPEELVPEITPEEAVAESEETIDDEAGSSDDREQEDPKSEGSPDGEGRDEESPDDERDPDGERDPDDKGD